MEKVFVASGYMNVPTYYSSYLEGMQQCQNWRYENGGPNAATLKWSSIPSGWISIINQDEFYLVQQIQVLKEAFP